MDVVRNPNIVTVRVSFTRNGTLRLIQKLCPMRRQCLTACDVAVGYTKG
jgi:hypothetical protein